MADLHLQIDQLLCHLKALTLQPYWPAFDPACPRGFFLIRKALFSLHAGEELFLQGEADRGSRELLKSQLPYSSKFDLHLTMFGAVQAIDQQLGPWKDTWHQILMKNGAKIVL